MAEFENLALLSRTLNWPCKIIATLGYPDDSRGMVKLTPEQQRSFLTKAPEVFGPCNGTWGERGATNIRLATATVSVVALLWMRQCKMFSRNAKELTSQDGGHKAAVNEADCDCDRCAISSPLGR